MLSPTGELGEHVFQALELLAVVHKDDALALGRGKPVVIPMLQEKAIGRIVRSHCLNPGSGGFVVYRCSLRAFAGFVLFHIYPESDYAGMMAVLAQGEVNQGDDIGIAGFYL